MTQPPDERGQELRDLFFETAHELLQSLSDDALKLERFPGDQEVIRSIRRTVHTIKGDAAATGFSELSELAHTIEDALTAEFTSDNAALVELSLTSADTFGAMIAAYQDHDTMPDAAPVKDLVRRLTSGLRPNGSMPSGPGTPKAAVTWTEYEVLAAQTARADGKKVFHIVAHIDPLCAMPMAARQLVTNAIASIAQIVGVRPEPGASVEVQRIDLLVATSQTDTLLISRCEIPTVIKRVECSEFAAAIPVGTLSGQNAAVDPVRGHKSDGHVSALQANTSEPSRSASADTVLRVDSERIDTVLNLVGELVIGKSMLQQVGQDFGERFPKDPLRARLSDAMAFQARVLNDLQRSVMKIRMVPVEQLFRRFPRIVRDTAQRCGKEVALELKGQDTDLDKVLLDAIAEPLTHIVRNAISHGIEGAAARKEAGKPAIGKLVLNAYHQANQLIVEVSDDGKGVDAEKVKAKAVKEGLIPTSELEHMTPQELLDLVFRPGFSTADEITEVSGRGVGLDVVRAVLHRLKGTVELETQPGMGTKFRLRLPLTLAIIKALLFRIERKLYAIPLNTVAEIARARESDLHRVENWEVLQLRGEVVPVIRLGDTPAEDVLHSQKKIFVLVINFGGRKWGLLVDALETEEELVIKSLDDQTIATDLVSGASILGDGRVVLIMNLAAVVGRFTTSSRTGLQAGLFHARSAQAANEVWQ